MRTDAHNNKIANSRATGGMSVSVCVRRGVLTADRAMPTHMHASILRKTKSVMGMQRMRPTIRQPVLPDLAPDPVEDVVGDVGLVEAVLLRADQDLRLAEVHRLHARRDAGAVDVGPACLAGPVAPLAGDLRARQR